MSLCFYIDDSGKNDPPVFVLGGVAVATNRMPTFEAAWRSELANEPAIPFFKMRDANRRSGVFNGISVAARDKKMEALAAIVRTHAGAILSVTVQHDAYKRVFTGRMMHWMDQPYQLLFHLMIVAGYQLSREHGLEGPAEFVFDRQLEHEDALRGSLPFLMANVVPEIRKFLSAAPRHADDRDEVLLQAADLVAWHIRRSWKEGPPALVRASRAGPTLAAIPGRHEIVDDAMLEHVAGVATATIRSLNTVFPYEAARMAEQFATLATTANYHLIASAKSFQVSELISFPAIGTAKYRLVRSCAQLGRPHLHRKRESRCLGEASAE